MRRKFVKLSTTNKLSKETKNIFGAKKYKIVSNYILTVVKNKRIYFSDGTYAIVDKRDSMHISNAAGINKISEIYEIKKICNNAVLYAIDEKVIHNKFDIFKYYKANVCLNGKTYELFVNVGRAKNSKEYHIYDLTRKIRESAHRVNDVERLTKSIALQTDSLKMNISSKYKNGK